MIRNERPEDLPHVATVVERAFGQDDEARLVERLRADGDAVISLVAETEEGLVGQILLSRLDAPFRALALAPVSVMPEQQGGGIGSSLIEEGLRRAREQGWAAVFVLGAPEYYRRFGFRADLAQGFSCIYAGPYFMVLPLAAELPASSGRIGYPAAFETMG